MAKGRKNKTKNKHRQDLERERRGIRVVQRRSRGGVTRSTEVDRFPVTEQRTETMVEVMKRMKEEHERSQSSKNARNQRGQGRNRGGNGNSSSSSSSAVARRPMPVRQASANNRTNGRQQAAAPVSSSRGPLNGASSLGSGAVAMQNQPMGAMQPASAGDGRQPFSRLQVQEAQARGKQRRGHELMGASLPADQASSGPPGLGNNGKSVRMNGLMWDHNGNKAAQLRSGENSFDALCSRILRQRPHWWF